MQTSLIDVCSYAQDQGWELPCIACDELPQTSEYGEQDLCSFTSKGKKSLSFQSINYTLIIHVFITHHSYLLIRADLPKEIFPQI